MIDLTECPDSPIDLTEPSECCQICAHEFGSVYARLRYRRDGCIVVVNKQSALRPGMRVRVDGKKTTRVVSVRRRRVQLRGPPDRNAGTLDIQHLAVCVCDDAEQHQACQICVKRLRSCPFCRSTDRVKALNRRR